jgi:hypothetical protein
MLKKFEYKVPGGKLLRAKLETTEGRISFIQLTGDFFMEPETDLEELEARLRETPAEPDSVGSVVIGFFSEKRTVIAGACATDFVYVINQALRA